MGPIFDSSIVDYQPNRKGNIRNADVNANLIPLLDQHPFRKEHPDLKHSYYSSGLQRLRSITIAASQEKRRLTIAKMMSTSSDPGAHGGAVKKDNEK